MSVNEINKLASFFSSLSGTRIYPRYATMVRTGRTSSYGPNVQQLPREGGIRETIVAPPEHSFYICDYSFIELRTLAAVCESRYGFSKLGEVIRQGDDPHCFTAALFEGVSLEEFNSWKRTDRFKHLRQRAKALNFGIPGGLGAKTLVQYAAATYGVELTIDDTREFRERLITDVYSELTLYLHDDVYAILAERLTCDQQAVRQAFRKPEFVGCMRRIMSGETTKSGTDEPYPASRINAVWRKLTKLNENPELEQAIIHRDISLDAGLSRRLFATPVATLTGRVRGAVGFTAARNTPFQGLAADGAKLALYALVKHGYQVVAFVHDEFVVAVPDSANWAEVPNQIDAIVCEEMGRVCGTVPIAVEGARAKRWSKDAEAVYDEDGNMLVWEPKSPHETTS